MHLRLNKKYINAVYANKKLINSPEIKKERTEPTTGETLSKILGFKVPIIAYHTLGNYNTIDDLLKNISAVIILYEQYAINAGHYCALIRVSNDLILFFDPYGCTKPDDEQLEFNELKINKELQQNNKTILNMLKESPYDYYSSPYEFQSLHYDIGTCGLWCSAIIAHVLQNKKTIADFARMFDIDNKYGARDSVITAIAYANTPTFSDLRS